MLLDIGAKTSNLLFFEKGKVFSRSIALGANSITQDFANEGKLKFEIAEQIKVREGFVSLGGAYEEPENQDQATIERAAAEFPSNRRGAKILSSRRQRRPGGGAAHQINARHTKT